MTTTPHLNISLVEQSQAQKEVTINTALSRIDALMNSGAISRTTSTPPGSPAAGDVYIIGPAATGAWAGLEDSIAYYDSGWKFITPLEGMTLWVNDEDVQYIYDGSTWQSQAIVVYTPLTGTAHTLDGSYVGKTISFTNASAIVLTLPNSLYVGFQCRIVQSAAGQVTFTPDTGANRRNRQSHTKTAGQYAVCTLEVVSNSGGASAEYILSGDTAV
jgi:hypothetical protein